MDLIPEINALRVQMAALQRGRIDAKVELEQLVARLDAWDQENTVNPDGLAEILAKLRLNEARNTEFLRQQAEFRARLDQLMTRTDQLHESIAVLRGEAATWRAFMGQIQGSKGPGFGHLSAASHLEAELSLLRLEYAPLECPEIRRPAIEVVDDLAASLRIRLHSTGFRHLATIGSEPAAFFWPREHCWAIPVPETPPPVDLSAVEASHEANTLNTDGCGLAEAEAKAAVGWGNAIDRASDRADIVMVRFETSSFSRVALEYLILKALSLRDKGPVVLLATQPAKRRNRKAAKWPNWMDGVIEVLDRVGAAPRYQYLGPLDAGVGLQDHAALIFVPKDTNQ